MQIVVLGMHRSGTSMLTRLINQLGAYCGEPEDFIGTNEENPKGFWERQDVRDANDAVLKGVGLDWDRVATFNANDLTNEHIARFDVDAAAIIEKLNIYPVWVMKEPRVCLLLDLWTRKLNDPFFIHIYRNPMEVAASLEVRNGIHKPAGIALWELYNRQALRLADQLNYLRLDHFDLLAQPYEQTLKIYNSLRARGARGLTAPDKTALEEFIDPKLHRQQYNEPELESYLAPPQLAFHRALQTNSLVKEVSELSPTSEDGLALYERQYVFRDEIRELKREIQELNHTNKVLQDDLHRSEARVGEASRIGERATEKIEEIDNSTTWRLGVRINNWANMLLLKRKTPPNLMKVVLELRSQLRVYSVTSSSGNS